MTEVQIGSLCSGYGGLDRAVTAVLGGRVVWHTETDPAASLVLDKRYDSVPNHGDIKVIDWRSVEPVDIVCGGIPCQPFSAAGNQLAEADERYLWPAARSALAVLRPRVFVLENVANLPAMRKGVVFRKILDDLRALGYRVVWGVFGACLAEVAGCHHRHRVFVLAEQAEAPIVVGRWPGAACGVSTRGRSPAPLLPTPSAASYGSNQGGAAGRVGPVRHSLDSLARLDLLPTPTVNDSRNGRNATAGRSTGAASAHHTGTTLADVAHAEHFGRYAAAVARWSAVHGLPPTPTELGSRGGVRLAPAFSEWMMGLAPGFVTNVVGRTDALKIIGNGVFPLQAYVALTTLRGMLISS
jgi:DNA (cytosine-5)-methyltransferase 1